MPREKGAAGAKPPRPQSPSPTPAVPDTDVPVTVRRALRPWVDLDELGLPGLWVWLETIAPLLPKPAGEDPGAPRVEELARALADCAGDRARAHFQAAEYFRENQALARRVKALEAMLALRRATDPSAPVPGSDPEAEMATRRYLRGQRP